VTVIGTATGTVKGRPIQEGVCPIAIAPDGKTAYATNVTVIDSADWPGTINIIGIATSTVKGAPSAWATTSAPSLSPPTAGPPTG